MNTYPKDPLMTSNETASSLKKHNDIFQNQKCSIHQNVPFEFFCFDDRTFLCGSASKSIKNTRWKSKKTSIQRLRFTLKTHLRIQSMLKDCSSV